MGTRPTDIQLKCQRHSCTIDASSLADSFFFDEPSDPHHSLDPNLAIPSTECWWHLQYVLFATIMDSERKESSKIMQFVVVELRTKAGLTVMLNFKRKVVILRWPCWLPPRCFFGFPLRCHGSRVAHDKQRRLINEDMTRQQNAGRWHRRCSSSPGRRLVRRTLICFRANWLTLRGKFWSGKLTMRNIESGETVITFTSLSVTMRCNRIDEKWAGRRENFFWNLIWREKRKKSGRWRGRRRRVWLTFLVLRELWRRERIQQRRPLLSTRKNSSRKALVNVQTRLEQRVLFAETIPLFAHLSRKRISPVLFVDN